jgi:YHS domain-containing protein
VSVPAASRQSTGSGQRTPQIRQTAYQPDQKPDFSESQFGMNGQKSESSTVQAELNRMFQQHRQPAAPATTTVAARSQPAANGNIKQVQHRTEDRERSPQREGLLRRWYRRVTGSDETEPAVSQPGPQIPSPPPIDYGNSQNKATSASGVPARPAAYNSSEASPQQPGSGSPVMSIQGNYPTDPMREAHAKPAQDNRFVSPFEEDAASDPDEALLDLESLIRDRRDAKTDLKNSRVDSADRVLQVETAQDPLPDAISQQASRKSATSAASNNPKPAQPKVTSAQEQLPSEQSTEDPFTGYQLPSDDELLGQSEGRGLSEPEPAPPAFAESALESVSNTLAEQADPVVIKVPLLEEPVMALPKAIPEQHQEPLSQESAEESEQQQRSLPLSLETPRDATPEPVSDSGQRALLQTDTSRSPSAGEPDLRALDTQAKREQQRFRIMSRTGQTGFKGFCPVELRDHRELVDAREKYRAKFGLQTYYFSSPEARLAFEANPARYAPAGGGSDVVLLVNTGEETPGSLDFSLWYRDRLYLFRSRETQAIFSQDPKRYADQY